VIRWKIRAKIKMLPAVITRKVPKFSWQLTEKVRKMTAAVPEKVRKFPEICLKNPEKF
jgi:hypothetical protein